MLNDILTMQDSESSDQLQYESTQRLINAGQWGLEGSVGRAMMDAIDNGYCLLGKNRARDYYGNFIPSRDDVVEGTKGSYQFVVDRMGQDWADRMAAL